MIRDTFRGAARSPARTIVAALMLALGAAGGLGAAARPARAAQSAVVFMYHRFGEEALPATNIRIDQFEAQIAELVSGKYTVLPIPEILAALRAGRSLPERTIGLSVDDAFLSVYREAWPRLKKAGLPFTLFVATDPVDEGLKGFMSWDQIRELAKAGVTIGSQTASHLHMASSSAEKNRADLAKSNRRFQAELGMVPTIIAYPYGEYSLAVRDVVKAAGFAFGFGQHSGVLHPKEDFYYLPRFALNEAYGGIARFRLAANALPLMVEDVTPADPLLGPGGNPPAYGFTVVGEAVRGLSRLACYTAGQGKARIERLGESRIEVRLARAFPPGRTRINCTMPAGQGRWRWFGRQFYVPKR